MGWAQGPMSEFITTSLCWAVIILVCQGSAFREAHPQCPLMFNYLSWSLCNMQWLHRLLTCNSHPTCFNVGDSGDGPPLDEFQHSLSCMSTCWKFRFYIFFLCTGIPRWLTARQPIKLSVSLIARGMCHPRSEHWVLCSPSACATCGRRWVASSAIYSRTHSMRLSRTTCQHLMPPHSVLLLLLCHHISNWLRAQMNNSSGRNGVKWGV